MNTETFFTLGEYKQNYNKFQTEFVEAYEDNDEEEFISLQIEWYQKCSLNTELEWTVFDGDIGWFPKVFFNDNVVIWEVIEKFRNKNGGMNQTAAQNLSVSFKKILKFLGKEKQIFKMVEGNTTQVQWALYHYVLQECEIKPRFQHKVKDLKKLAQDFNVGFKNLQLKYNHINNSGGQEGYSDDDVSVVEILLEKNYPSAIAKLREITKHVF